MLSFPCSKEGKGRGGKLPPQGLASPWAVGKRSHLRPGLLSPHVCPQPCSCRGPRTERPLPNEETQDQLKCQSSLPAEPPLTPYLEQAASAP